MFLQDFARRDFVRKVLRQIRLAPNQLFAVEVFENDEWMSLPEKHHKEKLAVSVAIAEAKSRDCPVYVRTISTERGVPSRFLMMYWPGGLPRHLVQEAL